MRPLARRWLSLHRVGTVSWMSGRPLQCHGAILGRYAEPIQVSLTFLLVSLGWTLFVFDFQEDHFLTSLAGFGTGLAPTPITTIGPS